MSQLAARRGGRVYELIGPRSEVRVDRDALRGLVPDLAERDVYVCGPDGFADRVVRAARGAGVGRDRIHRESFAF
jgi:ferredoxin-NADP reductase